MRQLLRPPSPAMLVALIALIVAGAGTSFAAFQLPRNSVGSKQIKAGAVTNGKVKDGALTGRKIQSSTLGLVPNASHARNADHALGAANAGHALSADRLQGDGPSAFVAASSQQRIDFRVTLSAYGTNEGDVLSLGGLTLHASCSTTSGEGVLTVTSHGASQAETNTVYTAQADSGTPQAQFTGYPGTSGTVLSASADGSSTGFQRMVGTIVYRDPESRATVTVPFFAFVAVDLSAPTLTCELYGNATETHS